MPLDITAAFRSEGTPISFSVSIPASDWECVDDMRFLGNASVSGEVVAVANRVHITGQASAAYEGECALCLRVVKRTVKAPLDEEFIRAADLQGETDARVYEGQSIDLSEAVREALLLELPLRLLCKKSCKGLCPVCGQDRNQADCGHGEGEKENPFAVLRQLLEDKEV